jgi:hypothetical protein
MSLFKFARGYDTILNYCSRCRMNIWKPLRGAKTNMTKLNSLREARAIEKSICTCEHCTSVVETLFYRLIAFRLRYPIPYTQDARSTEFCPQRPAVCCPPLHQSCPPTVFGIPTHRRFPASMDSIRSKTHSFLPRLGSEETRERRW